MLVQQITDHINEALGRRMQQYKDLPNFQGMLDALVLQIQELEDAIFPLNYGRSVYGSQGLQLDRLGTLVGIERNGLSDAQYLLFILGKIGEDTSDTTIDKISAVYSILMNATRVQEQDLFPAGVGLACDGSIQDFLDGIVWTMVQNSLGAGIRLEFLEVFDPTEAFAFAGGAGPALGFGDANDLALGGKFAYLLDPDFDFAFFSNDSTDSALGFGDAKDPIVGGMFDGITD